ncbi:SSU ribosomal protein S2P [Parasphingorhabdus marina DSM 22363]|uniref:Small ribosomal subunit protein uS2 n=1 Tax=Parasphingorhabdus marina DSM 22363 TaxID=1123272 RepID=A0A1N6GFD2_9SPHN|nr:SSU ribosomal protein S2P [Parasphingorhabdus marina DSM 22363]
MAAPVVTLQQLIEAGSHFGHQTHRWNPKMKPYIFGARNGVHILDLSQSVPLFARALDFIANSVAAGGKVLFVGTKRQAQEPIAEAARVSGQHFVNHRWLGGMLTNWKTISNSIRRMKTLEEQLSGDTAGFTKKEVLQMTRERDKLELSLGGIRDMGGIPDVMFVIDANKEELAIKEANVLGIPVVAILDSNVDPTNIAFPVPGNDDAARAIRLYCESVAAAATKGGQEAAVASGEDLGAAVAPPVEQIVSSEANASAMASGEEAAVADIAEKAAEKPTEEAPAEAPKAEEAPAEEAPAKEEAKVEVEPAKEEAPAEDEAKAEEKPAKKAAAKKAPAKKAAAKKAPAKKPAAKKAPAKKAPAKKAAAKKEDAKAADEKA